MGINLVTEDDDFQLLHYPGPTEHVVVSFPHLYFNTKEVYWGRTAVETAGLSAVGIVCKHAVWYPGLRSIGRLLDDIGRVTRRYKSVVTCGSSMGGYAAFKYSRALSATAIAAFSPQWSIDPREVGHFEGRFREFFDAPSCGHATAIKSHDVSAPAIAFFDPADQADAEHFRQIRNASEYGVLGVALPNCGHETARALGRRELAEVLRIASRGVVTDVIGLLRRDRDAAYLAPAPARLWSSP